MNGYLTDYRLRHVTHLPVSLPQTELKAGASLFIASFKITMGQRLEIRSLTLHLVSVLTNGLLPSLNYSAYKTCSLGLYRGASDCSPLVYAAVEGNGISCANTFRNWVIESPGEYRVVVRNNTNNLDLSVAAAGAVKLYY